MQEKQVEYLDDSEVDFSSDDDEEDMEDFAGADGARPAPGWLGKRPAGTPAFLAVVIVHETLHDHCALLFVVTVHDIVFLTTIFTG